MKPDSAIRVFSISYLVVITSRRTSIRSFRSSLESIPEADEEPPPVIQGPEPAQDPEVEHHHHDSGPGDLASSTGAPLMEGALGPDALARAERILSR